MSRARRIRGLALVVSGALLAGCIGSRSAPTRFYVLDSLADARPSQPAHEATSAAIGVGPVQISKALDRPQITTRSAPNALDLAEFDRWGEPLADGITRVLAENLMLLVPTDRVTVYPFRGTANFDYQVVVEVMRFGERPDGDVELMARWAILRKGKGDPVTVRKVSFRESPAGAGYPAVVAAMSRALISLSEEIADPLRPLLRR